MFWITVPQGHVVLVQRLGQHHRMIGAGFHFLVPFFDSIVRCDDWNRIASKQGYLIELAEQRTDTPTRVASTKDNVQVHVDAAVYWQILDPVKARYSVDRLPESVADMALNVLRTAVGQMMLDECLSRRPQTVEYILQEVTKSVGKWGVKVIRVEIQTLQPSTDHGSAAMVQEMSAEREKRAEILRAEGRRRAAVLDAEAARDAAILRAEGEAIGIRLKTEAIVNQYAALSESMGKKEAVQFIMLHEHNATLRSLSKDPSAKVFLPFLGIPSHDLRMLHADGMSGNGERILDAETIE